ncbi:hypothetical protein Gorai_005550, partial [Gossypium raimondii]|nr:hypothetical protein [Gossypium raimondii]
TGDASTGGLLRDQYGDWILGFNHYLRRCTTFETDNLEVVRALQDNPMVDSRIIVLRRIQRIMRAE